MIHGENPARGMVSPERVAAALGLHPPTPEQSKVIAAPIEPSLVVAGAGAGKTETMAARVVWLVVNGIVPPERVLGLTFTRKASRQLAERVRARLRKLAGSELLDEVDPSGKRRAIVLAGEPTILTYHAYAGRLLGEHGLRLPVQPGVRLLSETASWQLAHRVVSTWDNDLDTDRVPASVTAQVLSLAGELAEHLVDREKLKKYTQWLCEIIENAPRAKGQRAATPQKILEIVAAQKFRLDLLPLIETYQQRKRTEGVLDFGDQMSLAARLAQEHPEVVEGERERYGAVLLDEYQDTGHAQRILLSALFGGGTRPPIPVTAVGDPAQAIYGWRGASAANLPRFTTDFPLRQEGKLAPAHEFGLLTSFRNPPEVLTLANNASEPLRSSGLGVQKLRAKDGAGSADIAAGLFADIQTEREWLARAVADKWFAEREETGRAPTAAVLVRRRADMAPLAAELRACGLPVEVVGLGGLLNEPEVADLVATLRLLADPLSGTAAARLLTGARWRLTAADLAALWKRARDLSAHDPAALTGAQNAGADREIVEDLTVFIEQAEQTGLVDALDDPGEQHQYRYSDEGYRRIQMIRQELARLRSRLDQSLPELVADVERTLLLDVESLSRPSAVGRAHLDAFADVVTDFALTAPSATLLSFVDYLTTAAHAEDGLTPGEVEVSPDRVQVLTMHSAKGLEWRIVAIPHLVTGVFPTKRRSSSWLRTSSALPAILRGDAQDLPELAVSPGQDRKEVAEALESHEEAFVEREAQEERRLFYVALTRSEHALFASGHWWNETSTKPRGPSEFLVELAEALGVQSGPTDSEKDSFLSQKSGAKESSFPLPEKRENESFLGRVVQWAAEPTPDAENPMLTQGKQIHWPVDPLGNRRAAVVEGADLVLQELAKLRVSKDTLRGESSADGQLSLEWGQIPDDNADLDPDGWIADTDVLIAERANSLNHTERVILPEQLSVSQLVELADDPEALARRLRRPLPHPPNAFARRGTAFHAWLESRFGAERLLDIDDLPGAADATANDDRDLEALQHSFEQGEWANRIPYAVEIPFATQVDGVTVRGRMDAVFAEEEGNWVVVDWKTGAVPEGEKLRALAVQLTAYRLAWAGLRDIPVEKVRAAFYYVRADRTVWPEDLLDEEGLRELVRSLPQN